MTFTGRQIQERKIVEKRVKKRIEISINIHLWIIIVVIVVIFLVLNGFNINKLYFLVFLHLNLGLTG